MIDVLEYIRKKQWVYKMDAGKENARLRTCPLPGCGGTNDFVIHIYKKSWQCFKCSESGSIYTLMRTMGDLQELDQSYSENGAKPSAIVNVEILTEQAKELNEKLFRRKNREVRREMRKELAVDDDTLENYCVGLDSRKDGNWIAFPHFVGDHVFNIKFRTMWPLVKSHRRIAGAETVIYNQNILDEGGKGVIVCAGEKDALKLCHEGFTAVGVSGGEKTRLTEKMLNKLEHLRTIWVAFDSDIAGEEGAEQLSRQLGKSRCRKISVRPSKDVLDFFKDHEDEAYSKFTHLFKKAPRFDSTAIITMAEAVRIALRKRVIYGDRHIITPWPSLNNIVHSFDPGDLVVVSARRETGKTSLCTQIAYYQAATHEIPSLIYCKEMKAHRIATRIVQGMLDVGAEDLDPLDFIKAERLLRGVPIYTAINIESGKFEDDCANIKAAVIGSGVQLVVFDNLHFIARDIKHRSEEVSSLMKQFKELALNLDVVILLVAQPRKMNNTTRIMDNDDLGWSGSIADDADFVIMMHRDEEYKDDKVIGDRMTLIRVTKARYESKGQCVLEFMKERSTFVELEEDE